MNQRCILALLPMVGLGVSCLSDVALAQTRPPQFELPAADQTSTTQRVDVPVQTSEEVFGRCQQDQQPELGANDYFRLVVSDEAVGSTVEAYPTVLAYVPTTSASHVAVTVKRLRDGLNIYQSTMRVRQKSLNPIQYPDYLPPLEVGAQYLWSVSLLCESVVLSYNPVAQLTLMRQSPNRLPEELEDPLAIERAQSLGEMGVWHDMVSRLYYEAVHRRSSIAMEQLKDIVLALDIPLGERL